MGGRRRGAPVVAIDGPAGSGKSTLARQLATVLGLPYVNTGLMYRALTLKALWSGVDPGDGAGLVRLARRIRFDLSSTDEGRSLQIDGAPPMPELSIADVEANVSEVSRHPEVRALMRRAQRRLGDAGAVMEGRDIGSVIFPDADVKIFLAATPAERIARRSRERRGTSEAGGRVADSLPARDRGDAQVNPFVPAKDAVPIDTTGRRADEVFEEAIAIVRARLGVAG